MLRAAVRLLLRSSFNPCVLIVWQRRIVVLATRLRFFPRKMRCEMTTLDGVPTQPTAGRC